MKPIIEQQTEGRDTAARDAAVGWGAAIVDENGNETPITESMITRACDELARSWTFPRSERLAGAH